MIQLDREIQDSYVQKDPFDEIMRAEGTIYREQKNRKTLQVLINGRPYFIKLHQGAGLREIFKNLLQLKWPVLSIQNELHAINRLAELGIDTMTVAGYGIRGIPPAWLDSFIITRKLENTVSLEDFTRNWSVTPPDFKMKISLIERLAEIARRLHENGINHRDFYLCHFLLDLSRLTNGSFSDTARIYLIDLHRAQIRNRTPRRWVKKDLSGLLFSAMDLGLTRRDLVRFMKVYRGTSLRTIFRDEHVFWIQVVRQSVKLYKKHFHRLPKFQIPNT